MAKVTISNIGQAYGGNPDQETWAVKPLDLTLESGRSYALVGPSGCGKTTILNMLSGIVTPTQGQIFFDDKDVTALPVSKRNIAQVFQFPTIYKSMTVFDNLAFPLVCRNWEKEKIKVRVGQIAEQIGLSGKLDRSANKLGADEKQIISLGRGLVRDDVTALLMDEPLTVIDPQLKFDLRKKIKQIVQGKEITIVYVTHDQYEAMTFADELLVMSFGRMIQRGSPEDLFERPNSKYVGNFIGSPAMNFIRAEIVDGQLSLMGHKMKSGLKSKVSSGQLTEAGIRPEYVQVVNSAGENVLSTNLIGFDDLGATRILNCQFGDGVIKARVPREFAIPARGEVLLKLPAEKLLSYQDGLLN
jgi:glycerol transport system ATP-binding protein